MHYILLLLSLLTGHTDAARLAAYADSTGVPREVMWAVAWQESRGGQRGNSYIGPGIVVMDTISMIPHRVCRERGRMQINPCYWKPLAPRCTWQRVRDNYSDNVWCAGLKLHSLRAIYGSWEEAIRRYNGSGPMSRAYQQRALAYIGRLALRDGTYVAP